MASLSISEHRNPRDIGLLVVFLVLVIGIGSAIGAFAAPGEWYASLAKPPFNPPNWVFAPVWFVLYVLIAAAGWRTFLDAPASARMALWGGQMVLNWIWSPIWFVAHMLWPAFAIIVLMLACTIGFIVTSWNRDRPSAYMFLPYAAWITFAGLLNLSVAILNP